MNDRALKKLTLCIENEFEEDVVIIFAEPSKQDLDQLISETRFFNLITDVLWTKKEQGKGYDRSVHNKENENEGRRKGEDLWLELWYKEMARRQMEKGLKVVQDADTLEEAKEESMEPNLDNEYTVKDELGINFEVKAELPPYIDDDKGDYLDASNSDFPLILDAHSLLNGDEKLKKKKTKSASGEKRIKKQPKEKIPKDKEQKEKKPRKKRIFSHGKLFPCDVCGRVCKDMSILTTHLRVHTNEKPYSCDVCQRAFSNKYNMIVHKRIHTGEKPHFCDACGKVCTTKQNLVLHMRTHTGEKPFACDLCEKSFAQVSLLNYHKRVHTGEKPYSCQTCGKAFSKHWNLKVHQKVHRKTVLVQNCI